MKILLVTPNFPYPAEKDGQTIIACHLLNELSQRHNLTLYCFADRADLRNKDCFSAKSVEVKFFKRPRRSRIFYYLTKGASPQPWFQYRHHSEGLWETLVEADQQALFDVVLLHSPYFSEYLNCFQKTPVVFSATIALSSWYAQFRGYELNPLKKLHYSFEHKKAAQIEAHCFSRAKAIIVGSEADKEVIEHCCPSLPVSAIPNGVDLDYFRPSHTQPDPNVIICTGSMDFPPNVQAVLHFSRHVWPRLKQAKPDLEWLIVGQHPTLDVFELQSLDQNITVTGYVKDIRPQLWRATVYISPLKLGRGFRNIILEAMACGKAVVATPNSVAAFPVENNREVLLALNRHEFFDQIMLLLDQPERRQKLELAARKLAELYSWPHTCRQYEEILEQAAHKGYSTQSYK